MNQNTDSKQSRRPYYRPEWEQVQLIAEEAVLTGCKAASAPGAYGTGVGSCQNTGGQTCQVLGS
jgi:hypothetical protein